MPWGDYGDPIGTDSPARQLARLRQAIWRVDELHIDECHTRTRRDGSTVNVGSELPHAVGPHAGRPNFISDAAFGYAVKRISDSHKPLAQLTILESRLRFNMLSSQPMCFNLFADLRALVVSGDPRGTAAIRAMFPDTAIDTVDSLVVEEVPLDSRSATYLGDRTGWDAAIWINGGDGLITIETKYTDPLDTSAPLAPQQRRADFARERAMFTDEGMDYYEALGQRRDTRLDKINVKRAVKGLQPQNLGSGPDFDQMARNLLLTEAYGTRNGLTTAVNYVLAPAFDEQAEPLVGATVARLAEPFRRIARYRTLDAVIDDALPVLEGCEAGRVLGDFRSRYLDLSPARARLTAWLARHGHQRTMRQA